MSIQSVIVPGLAEENELGGLPLADVWSLDFHAGFIFEIDAGRAEALVPDDLEVVEAAPGLALMSVIHAHYDEKNLGGGEPFDEVVCSILVHPDLSLQMPAPRLSFYVLDVWSNSAAFVEYKTGALGMPVHLKPSLRSTIAPDRLSTTVEDDGGRLFELGLGTVTPKFRTDAFCGQYFAQPGDTLNHGPWRWAGCLTEHQQPKKAQARLHAHPFFPSTLVGAKALRCNMQQLSEPGHRLEMRTYGFRTLDD